MTDDNEQKTGAEETTETQPAALIEIRMLDRIETIKSKAATG
ncbi:MULTISPECIES: hypothetical protein [Kitasatospora]